MLVHFLRFLLPLSVLMGGAAAGPAESESGGGPAHDDASDDAPNAAPVAAHVAASDAEHVAASDAAHVDAPVAAGGGCCDFQFERRAKLNQEHTSYWESKGYSNYHTTSVYSSNWKQRNMLNMCPPQSYEHFPCACCNREFRGSLYCLYPWTSYCDEDQYVHVCSECQAPVCSECKSFTRSNDLAREHNRCKWCLKLIDPTEEISLQPPTFERVEYFKQLDAARTNYPQLAEWFRGIYRSNRKFDFSRIWWIETTGWLFFADCDWFFQQKLEHEFSVVMASMLFNSSKRVRRRRLVPSHFGMFYGNFHEDQKKYLFQESRQIAVKHSIAFKMLTRMEMRFCGLVLRRVESKFARLLQNGLGVNPPPSDHSEDSEDDY